MHVAVLAFAVVVSAVPAALVSPPVGGIWLHPVVFVPALLIFARSSPRRSLALGWLGGACILLVTLPWLPRTVIEFSGLPAIVGYGAWLLHAVIFGAYLGVFGWGLLAVRRASGSAWPLGLAAWFVACEFLNPQLLPYHQSVAWYQVPAVHLVTSLTGAAGGSFLVLLCNTVVAQGLEARFSPRPDSSWRAVAGNGAILGVLLLCAIGWSQYRMQEIARAEAGVEPLRVALVQDNLYGDARRRVVRQGRGALGRELTAMTRAGLRGQRPVDVVVWSEGALARPPDASLDPGVFALVRESGAELWAGASYTGRLESGAPPFNAAFRIDAEGRLRERYDKTVLVPFGEAVPFADLVPALGRIPGLGRMRPGEHPGLFDAGDTRAVFLICYEAILPGFVRETARAGADLLVNVTYDGWFGDTAGPHQHLMLAAVQSAQLGIPMVRAASTGISAFIDARGVIGARAGWDTREVLTGEVRPVQVPSPYGRFGDWFGWLCVAASLSLLARSWRDRGRVAA